jgi:hypothetical protein
MVAHELIGRPIIRVGDVATRTVRDAAPSGPEEERRERLPAIGIRERLLAHRIAFTELSQTRIVSEQAAVVISELTYCCRACGAQRENASARVVAVLAELAAQIGLEPGGRRVVERGKRLAKPGL